MTSATADLVGKTAVLPLVGRHLTIIADDYVKTDFGTGALKITPGHDPNDFEIGRRHELDEVSVIGEDGRMTAEAGPDYAGFTVQQAREKVVAALERAGPHPPPRALHRTPSRSATARASASSR